MRRNKAALNGVAVALYILSPVFVIAFSVIGNWLVGLILLFVCIAVATGLKVYSASVTKPYERADDSMVEEFKEWHRGRERQKTKMETYSGILWPLIVATYFILSFATHAWYITWIVFVIGAAVQQLIKLLVLSKER